jgi:hypothetical protein
VGILQKPKVNAKEKSPSSLGGRDETDNDFTRNLISAHLDSILKRVKNHITDSHVGY